MKKVRTVQLLTKEGEEFLAAKYKMPWEVYPRPHMRRDSFFCLNGEWNLGISEKGGENDTPLYGEMITVPFVPESVYTTFRRAFHIAFRKAICRFQARRAPRPQAC